VCSSAAGVQLQCIEIHANAANRPTRRLITEEVLSIHATRSTLKAPGGSRFDFGEVKRTIFLRSCDYPYTYPPIALSTREHTTGAEAALANVDTKGAASSDIMARKT
jgi:hypothetical protein